MKYSERTLRNKAKKIGWHIKKGAQHYMCNGAVWTNINGERITGYMVQDLTTGIYEWGCYDSNYDHLWTLEDVQNFLESKYKELKLDF